MADVSTQQRVYPGQPHPTYYRNRPLHEVCIEMGDIPAYVPAPIARLVHFHGQRRSLAYVVLKQD
ncbi:hypothetical protein BJY00DRAFT_306938 [Aspergillus carlsbadensis]|nr:hypothetical protein BJY00DRAFT_306938 [Aspergillus carlsbadensis]